MAVYTISYAGATAKIKSKGAELCSYVSPSGREYMWGGDPAIWPGHSPVLFPNVCSLKEGKVRFAGETYYINKHGFLAGMEFVVVEQAENKLVMMAEANADTLSLYPYNFAVYITHTIAEDGFATEFRVENKGEKIMPMCIGGHPGFVCPMHEGESFTDYILEFPFEEAGENMLCPLADTITGKEIFAPLKDSNTLALKHAYFDEKDALMLDNLRSRSVKLIHKDTKKGLEFFFKGFDVLGVWTKPHIHGDYICLEPWCGLPAFEDETGDFEDKPYAKFVEPDVPFKVVYIMKTIE